ncbi:endoribonuclease L-PSP [Caballeronia novacaledonica]|uniref:Endoribonuclease L-PSP n=1 Tax=Caballeronia novacaledonica TaxID=1544861 RepID=A0A2U3IFA8_9BURK|nr:FkbO/Hyg5 family chorismatase [Caballeronia novacaledonica]SPB18913.1 endoribonuclease L-PSP [Caballeronia novacaledonica]
MTAAIESRFIDPDAIYDADALARIVFGDTSGPPGIENGVPTLRLKMYGEARDGFAEIWTSAGPIRSGSVNGLVFAHNDEFLFCAGFIPVSDRYTDATRHAYGDAFALAGELNFAKIFRMWNFIPHINGANDEGLEVYRDFCRGRAVAFEQDYANASGMPAATGIGTWGDGVGFCFLACRESTVRHIENSRQTPAYEYPQRYGPKSPSFARGTQLHDTLFVSGTASILGHETVHEGDLDRQWSVATDNIAHLIGAENLEAQGLRSGYTLHDLDQIKVYYRHSADLPRVTKLAQATFDSHASVRYLKVDICRADLLVEIEGIASHRRRSD